MAKYIWVKRSPEWIKENPGKGTMYKVLAEETKHELKPTEEVKKVIKVKTPPKVEILNSKFGGVYAIINEHNKYIYIGQSLNPKVKIRHHKMNIKANSKDILYKLMIEHKEHLKYIVLECNINVNLLTLKESEYITNFLNKGYKLYNIYVPALCLNRV